MSIILSLNPPHARNILDLKKRSNGGRSVFLSFMLSSTKRSGSAGVVLKRILILSKLKENGLFLKGISRRLTRSIRVIVKRVFIKKDVVSVKNDKDLTACPLLRTWLAPLSL